jgi:hypothetical protein
MALTICFYAEPTSRQRLSQNLILAESNQSSYRPGNRGQPHNGIRVQSSKIRSISARKIRSTDTVQSVRMAIVTKSVEKWKTSLRRHLEYAAVYQHPSNEEWRRQIEFHFPHTRAILSFVPLYIPDIFDRRSLSRWYVFSSEARSHQPVVSRRVFGPVSTLITSSYT